MQPLADLDLSGQVALVTGAARGIGAATVRLLRARGARVAVHCFRSEPLEAGDVVLRADLSVAGAAAELMAAAVAHLGPVDYLVNNAAFTPRNPLRAAAGAPLSFQRADAEADFDPVLFDRAMGINVRVPLELALAAPRLTSIVNIGSGGTQPGDGSSAYFMLSKAAVPALTRYLARRLAPHTRANAVLPGWIATEEIAARGAACEPLRQEVVRRTPMGRLGEPDELAETIVYLLAGNSFITGEVLTVDGGWHL